MSFSGFPEDRRQSRRYLAICLLSTLVLIAAGENERPTQHAGSDVEVSVTVVPGLAGFQLPASELRLKARPLDVDPGKGLSELEAGFTATPGATRTGTSLSLRSGVVWELTLDAVGLWAEPAIIFLEKTRTTISMKARPTGTVTAVLAPPAGHALPVDVRARFSEAPRQLPPGLLPSERKPPAFEGETRCELEGAMLSCPVVAGRVDFSIHAKGFVAHYFWDVALESRAKRSLSTLRLLSGASLSGWVVIGEGSGKLAQVTLEIAPPLAAADPDWEFLTRFQKLTQTAKPNTRGFFQFQGIAPGGYALSAKLDGYATTGPFRLQVVEKLETQVAEPLVLSLPEQLEVFFAPPMAPGDMPWRVKYAAQDRVPGTYKEILEEAVSETGWVRLEGLQPGKYLLLVEGAEGDQWHGEELTIERSPPPHNVEVEIVKVKGRVLLGKKPLASTLFFGGRFGATRIKLVAGADGNFEGFLPREGRWQLDVLASKPRVSRRIESVEVSRQQGEDAAFVKIVLPATRVTGVVVDERGEPPRRALVRATPFAGKMQEPLTSVTISDKDAGRFVFEGFPEGGLLLSAEVGADWESERLLVNVAEGVEPPEAKLVVRPVRRFHGRVVSAGGQAVPGASIEVMPLGVAMAFVENEPAKFDGSFSFRMPPEARQAAMTVAAPGFALRSRIISLEQRETLVVSVDQVGGAVELRFPESNGEGATKLWPVLYGPSGVALNAGQLSKWAVLNGEVPQAGGALRAPNVEAGQYTLCLVPEGAGASQQTAPPPGGRCSTGYLPPLGSLQLAIDGSAMR